MSPPCCVVPLCSAKNSGGHRFPREPELRKKWIIAIKRDNYSPSKYARVCRQHFRKEDYTLPKESVLEHPHPVLRPGVVPSIFQWTMKSLLTAAGRKDRVAKQSNQKVVNTHRKRNLLIKEAFSESTDNKSNSGEICCEPETVHSDIHVSEVEVEPSRREVGVQTESAHVDSDYEGNCQDIDNGSTTMYSCIKALGPCPHDCGLLRIEHFMAGNKNAELEYLTGLSDFGHFIAVFSTLGSAAYELNYYRSDNGFETEDMHTSSEQKILSSPNEFFLVLVKLRCNTVNKELAFRYGISVTSVTRIIVTWFNFLFCHWKEINIWAPLEKTNENLQARGMKKTPYTVIIDFTEVKIQKPKTPVSQQETYSSNKSCNTVKVLVGISPGGAVTFVSDAYGGSTSNRSIFENCGLMDLLRPGDVVLVDRGFQIQDLLAARDITLRIPDSGENMGKKLEPEQINRSPKLPSSLIHVKRIISLAKKFKILNGPLSANLAPLAGRIVFVCFMLVNFANNIM